MKKHSTANSPDTPPPNRRSFVRSYDVRGWDGLPIEKTECFKISASKRYYAMSAFAICWLFHSIN